LGIGLTFQSHKNKFVEKTIQLTIRNGESTTDCSTRGGGGGGKEEEEDLFTVLVQVPILHLDSYFCDYRREVKTKLTDWMQIKYQPDVFKSPTDMLQNTNSAGCNNLPSMSVLLVRIPGFNILPFGIIGHKQSLLNFSAFIIHTNFIYYYKNTCNLQLFSS
jgi:hypothetical protein